MKKELDIYIPVSMDIDWPTKEGIISDILEQNREYGFTKFIVEFPGIGWRSIGYPPKEFIIKNAYMFKEIREELEKYGIECGWWLTLTIKSGKTEGFQSILKANGTEHPFANCPLDEAFKNRLASDVADFAEIAKPAIIITEDDFSLSAAMGCYCHLHMAEFEKRYGLKLTREELLEIMQKRTPEALDVIKKWRELAKDSLVGLAAKMREELDKKCPEIPMGYMQAGTADNDGDCTYEIAKAMAGENHTPFSRLYGAAYGGIVAREIPTMLFHLLYSKQHITADFKYLLEGDTFPHTRFFTAGCQMMSTMAAVFSYGFDGATFQTQQLLDGANEETAYGKSFAKERKRFNALSETVKDCTLKGVEIKYDPFLYTLDNDCRPIPFWVQTVARFGIPYVTTESDVMFLDERLAKYWSDAEIKKALSKVLFIDGAAAKVLCERGYGEYLGVEIGEDIKKGQLQWDFAAREVITEEYSKTLRGKNMTAPWMLAPKGNGCLPEIKITNPDCRVITEFYTYKKEFVTPAMTKFRNSLGGTVVVMGLTLKGNGSQALFNYRRKHLLQQLITECCDKYCYVLNDPDVMLVENAANAPEKSGFKEVITLINMCEDPLEEVALHLPSDLRDVKGIKMLDKNGEWQKASYSLTPDGVIMEHKLHYCSPMFLKIE